MKASPEQLRHPHAPATISLQLHWFLALWQSAQWAYLLYLRACSGRETKWSPKKIYKRSSKGREVDWTLKTNMSPWKIVLGRWHVLLKWPLFRGDMLVFLGVYLKESRMKLSVTNWNPGKLCACRDLSWHRHILFDIFWSNRECDLIKNSFNPKATSYKP